MKQQNSLHNSVNSLKVMIQQLENKPKDSSYDEEIKELKGEEAALLTVLQEISKRTFSTSCPMRDCCPTMLFRRLGSFCGRFSTESPMRNFRLPEKV